VVDGLIKKYAGRYDIRVMNGSTGDPEVDRLAQVYGIEYVPTFVFLNRDGSLSNKLVGSRPAAELEAEMAKLK
jgi:hypothetical protein